MTPQAAKALQAELAATLTARDFAFTGLGLHLYLGPQWEGKGLWKFRGKQGG